MAAAVSTSTSPSISVSSPPRTRVRGSTVVGMLPSSPTSSPQGSPQGLRVHTGGLSGEAPSFSRSKSVDSSALLNGFGMGMGGSQASSSGTSFANSMNMSTSSKRPRSSSILSMHEIKENADDDLDKSAFANLNADWVNYKGAWLIHVVLIVVGKVLVDSIPGIEQDTSWTIVLQGYLLATYIMFHFVEGVPFESNSGVYDRLTMWEQIDGGAQYTPARKWLTCLPIILFLLSTHYTRYDHHPALFSLNIVSLLALALIPKLPQLHRQRVMFGASKDSQQSETGTGANTPVETAMGRALLPSLPE